MAVPKWYTESQGKVTSFRDCSLNDGVMFPITPWDDPDGIEYWNALEVLVVNSLWPEEGAL